MSKANKAICDVEGCGKEFSIVNEKDPNLPAIFGAIAGTKMELKQDEKGELKETFGRYQMDICPVCWDKVVKFVDSLNK